MVTGARKFRKKPVEIEALQVTSRASIPDGVYQHVRWTPEEGYEVRNELHDTWLQFKLGDWLNVSDLNDIYPIAAAFMGSHYEAVDA